MYIVCHAPHIPFYQSRWEARWSTLGQKYRLLTQCLLVLRPEYPTAIVSSSFYSMASYPRTYSPTDYKHAIQDLCHQWSNWWHQVHSKSVMSPIANFYKAAHTFNCITKASTLFQNTIILYIGGSYGWDVLWNLRFYGMALWIRIKNAPIQRKTLTSSLILYRHEWCDCESSMEWRWEPPMMHPSQLLIILVIHFINTRPP